MGIQEVWSPASDGPIELVVDLANVCRSEDVPPTGSASLARLDVLADAWARWPSAFESPRVRLVADSTLRGDLSRDDRRRLKDYEADRWAEVHDYADPVILDHAERHGCIVLTRDQFVGFRRERPWIESAPDQFVTWHVDGNGVRLEQANWLRRSDYSVSRAVERDELKALRLDPTSRQGASLLRHAYRCDNPACMRRAFGPSDAEVAPAPTSHGGEPVCQGCRQPLTVVGRRAETAILKVKALRTDAEWSRLPMGQHASITVGRASTDLSLSELVSEEDLRRISREHLLVHFDGHRVLITDLGSSNGTSIEHWDRANRRLDSAAKIPEGVRVELRPRDRVTLGGVLLVERSGRRFPFDLAPLHDPAGPPSSAQDRQTREDL